MSINHKVLVLSAVLALLAGPAFGADEGTHRTHSKQMKSAGVKDGEAMNNAAPASGAAPEAVKPGPDSHCMHDKQMKNDAGVKDGDCMMNEHPAAAPDAAGKNDAGPTHRVHSKKMKNDAGVKDGEPMKDGK